MNWIHTSIIATAVVATATVGIASASMLATVQPAVKSDRLPVVANAGDYITIETRHDGVSVLQRIHID